MKEKGKQVCPAAISGVLDNIFRKLVHNPRKILADFVKEGMTVLDAGCGPGFFTVPMAEMVGERGKVIAADLQEGILEKLKNKIRGSELGKRVVLHKAEDDKFAVGEEVDFILVFYMLHEVGSQEKFLAEIKSILKPGGKVLLVEPKFHVSGKMFENSVEKAAALGFLPVAGPKIFFSRAVVLKK